MDLPNGLYDQLVTSALEAKLRQLDAGEVRLEALGADRLDELRDRLVETIRRVALDTLEPEGARLTPEACVEIANRLLTACARPTAGPDLVATPVRRLTAVHRAENVPGSLPETGLLASYLFAAGKGSPSLLSELRTELAAVDGVDILVSFIKWQGVRKLEDVLKAVTAVDASGRPRIAVRVLTTTYCGATERRAVDWLAGLPGVNVRISLDGSRTRLHAKAWILRRRSGFGTAYVGSANLSAAALTGGLEWTVKFTQSGDPALYDRATAHFETLWNDSEFQAYDPRNTAHAEALDRALALEGGRRAGSNADAPTAGSISWMGIEPRPFQIELLDRLAAERRHGRMRNLLVAATGTGKTVVAAFDYRRSCESIGGRPRLLFVAHRREILTQARRVFADVLREPGFGQMFTEGVEPSSFDHCFATVQSLLSRDVLSRFAPDHWHTVIVDECHHAASASYEELIPRLQPSVLLGLTATPERGDGKSILSHFDLRPDGTPSAELRLWQALDQELLAPFEYYGCADETDLSEVPWDRPGERAALSGLLTGNHARAGIAFDAFMDKVADPRRARALGFCVTVEHARFMADYFSERNIPSEVVSGDTPDARRRGAPGRLDRREVNVIFTCDLYNEGIDIPAVDTILFLRPTQSPVVFQQQLGRGLRRADQKDSCLVIDLVGRFREDFKFDRLLGVLTGLPKRRLVEQVEHGFSELPPGCSIQLDRISRERVLESLRHATHRRWNDLARELRAYASLQGKARPTLTAFLHDQHLDLEDCYPERAGQASGWTALRRKAGLLGGTPQDDEVNVGRRLPGILHHDDPQWLEALRGAAEDVTPYAATSEIARRRLDMIAGELFPSHQDPCTGEELLARLARTPEVRAELAELAKLLSERSDLEAAHLPGVPSSWPLVLHADYTLRELMMASGRISGRERAVPQGGVLAFHDEKIEFLFVTLDKSSGFSLRTAYHDYAISPTLFHWQSQNSAGPSTPAGRRYLAGGRDGWTFQLFVRETKDDAYRALGPVRMLRAEGEKPMSITWTLDVPLPAALFRRYSVLRSA
ncbi:MAG: DUF3427 domain-containing protein [Planctomycetota bacterium]